MFFIFFFFFREQVVAQRQPDTGWTKTVRRSCYLFPPPARRKFIDGVTQAEYDYLYAVLTTGVDVGPRFKCLRFWCLFVLVSCAPRRSRRERSRKHESRRALQTYFLIHMARLSLRFCSRDVNRVAEEGCESCRDGQCSCEIANEQQILSLGLRTLDLTQ